MLQNFSPFISCALHLPRMSGLSSVGSGIEQAIRIAVIDMGIRIMGNNYFQHVLVVHHTESFSANHVSICCFNCDEKVSNSDCVAIKLQVNTNDTITALQGNSTFKIT